jgi:putative ABC transport system ATP-binding protein
MSSRETDVRLTAVVRRRGDFTLGPLDLFLVPGSWTALTGPSGAGKTTLLNLVAGLDGADSGCVEVCGSDLGRLDEARRTAVRRASLGIVYQERLFVEHLTVAENVALRLVPLGVPARERRARAADELERLGLLDRLDDKVPALSTGERQRVAVARAGITEPRLLLADEPTASVDSDTGARVVEYLARLRERGTTLLVSSHDEYTREKADAHLVLVGGRFVS